jgi:hypothetical protein
MTALESERVSTNAKSFRTLNMFCQALAFVARLSDSASMSTSMLPKPDGDHYAHRIFSRAVQSLHTRRNAPPPIPIPVNPSPTSLQALRKTRKPATLPSVAVELSNYPPSLTRHDLHTLFKGFTIGPNFILPKSPRFAYPFRTFVWVAGEEEAERAVQELSGTVMGGRQIRVTKADPPPYEQKEVAVEELADELKIAIVSTYSNVHMLWKRILTCADTARVYYPHLGSKFLEVREHTDGALHYAYLQARDPVTVHSEPEAHLQPLENMTKWDLVAGSSADGCGAKGRDKVVRLTVLKGLQETVEKQGLLKKAWGQWKGSAVLDM